MFCEKGTPNVLLSQLNSWKAGFVATLLKMSLCWGHRIIRCYVYKEKSWPLRHSFRWFQGCVPKIPGVVQLHTCWMFKIGNCVEVLGRAPGLRAGLTVSSNWFLWCCFETVPVLYSSWELTWDHVVPPCLNTWLQITCEQTRLSCLQQFLQVHWSAALRCELACASGAWRRLAIVFQKFDWTSDICY